MKSFYLSYLIHETIISSRRKPIQNNDESQFIIFKKRQSPKLLPIIYNDESTVLENDDEAIENASII